MGGVVSSLLGGGFSTPEPVSYEPAPSTEKSEVEQEGVRDLERKKNRARAGGIRATLLSNPLGGNAPLGG